MIRSPALRALPTASRLPLVMACIPAGVLPYVEEDSGEAAERGNAIDDYLSRLDRMGREESLALVSEKYRAECEGLDLSELPLTEPGSAVSQLAVAWDAQTGKGREIGRNLGRDYGSLGEWEIAGSADKAAVTPGGSVVILDWKSGRIEPEPPATNKQIRALVLATARAWGRRDGYGAIVRIPPDEPPRVEWHYFNPSALGEIADELRDWAMRHREAEATVAAGGTPRKFHISASSCRWCSSFQFCQAWGSWWREVGMSWLTIAALRGEHAVVQRLENMTEPELPVAIEVHERLDILRKRFAEHLRKRVSIMGPIRLPSGKLYGFPPGSERVVDHDLARRELADAFGEGVAAKAGTASWTTSKTEIKAALKDVAPQYGGKIAPLERRIYARLRNVGALKRTVSKSLAEYEPEEETEHVTHDPQHHAEEAQGT